MSPKATTKKAAKKPAKARKKRNAVRKSAAKTASAASASPKETRWKRKPRARKNQKPCAVANCKRTYRAKGYCRFHYRKWRHGEMGKKRFKTCKDIGCFVAMAMNRHGYCESHYQNYYVKGMEVPHAPAPEKPEEKVAAAS